MGKDKKEGRGTEQKNTGGHGNDKYPQASQLKKKKINSIKGHHHPLNNHITCAI